MITTTAAGRTWHYSHNLGRQTAEHNQSKFGRTGGYCYPMDVAAAGNDILFVLSRGYGFENVARGFDIYLRIGKTTIDEDHIGDFARAGFTWPVGIAVSKSDGSVFASDEYECTISAFDPDGIQTFPEYDPDGEYFDRWGTKGSEPGMLNGPAGIAFDANDDLYVVDSMNNRVQAFTRTGEFLKTWGRPGVSEGEFNRPWGITIDRRGGRICRGLGQPPGAEIRSGRRIPHDVWVAERVGIVTHPPIRRGRRQRRRRLRDRLGQRAGPDL